MHRFTGGLGRCRVLFRNCGKIGHKINKLFARTARCFRLFKYSSNSIFCISDTVADSVELLSGLVHLNLLVLNHGGYFIDGLNRLLGLFGKVRNDSRNDVGRLVGLLGKLGNLTCNYCESLTHFAGSCRLNRRIK